MALTEFFLRYGSIIVMYVSFTCILVSIITEFTKEIKFLKKIPTMLQVLVLCNLVSFITFFSFLSYSGIKFQWYYFAAVFFSSFVCAIVCSKGWEYIYEITNRFYVKGEEVLREAEKEICEREERESAAAKYMNKKEENAGGVEHSDK